MKIANKTIQKLLVKHREVALLGKISETLGWDLNVNLPPKASQGRADQSAYLTKLITEKWLDLEFRKLLEKANGEKKLNKEEKAVVRNLNRGANYYYKIPKEVIVELTEASSKAFVAWKEAREEDDFGKFLPHLKSLIRISQTIADKLGYKDNPYDALLDLYEPGLTTKECKKIFSKLSPELSKLLRKIVKSDTYARQRLMPNNSEFPVNDQEKVSYFVLRKIGYDLNAGRLDISPHPFTSELGRQDIRITTRYSRHNFVESIMVALHEGGHALYEQGVSEDYTNTPLGGGVSLGIHESQSRFWENQVGRSREFISYIEPILRSFYHDQLSDIDKSNLEIIFNKVEPSLIRVEADEVTYNLHIALRFEIEEGLINGNLKSEDLPGIWNQKMKDFLDVVPESDGQGVLQDVHWSYGSFGYFPTYTLGNLYAAQITNAMKKEIDLDDAVINGELGTILSWLRTNIHKHGSLYFPDELIYKVSNEQLKTKYFLEYLNDKYTRIYNIKK